MRGVLEVTHSVSSIMLEMLEVTHSVSSIMLEIVSRIGGQVVGTDQQEIARTSGGSPEAISSRRQFPSDTPCNFLGILIGS